MDFPELLCFFLLQVGLSVLEVITRKGEKVAWHPRHLDVAVGCCWSLQQGLRDGGDECRVIRKRSLGTEQIWLRYWSSAFKMGRLDKISSSQTLKLIKFL